MFVRRITVLSVVLIMIFSSIVIIAPEIGSSQIIRDSESSVSGAPSNSTSFIIYLGENSQQNAQVQSLLNSFGLTASALGSLLSVNVPQSKVTIFKSDLSNIPGLSWSLGNNQVMNPMICAAQSVQGNLVPASYGPRTVASAYDFNWLHNHRITGKGITIGIVDAYGDPNIRYDVYAFDSVNKIAPINLTIDYANNNVPLVTNSSWALETATDVEWAHAMAPGANIVLIVAPNATSDTLQGAVSYAVDNKLANILSLSWGIAESLLHNQTIQLYSKIYQQAAEENITIVAASGDSGAYDGQSQLTVNFPASDPYVTGVGGTYLYNSNGVWKQTAWGGSNGGTNSYGSGGGYSQYFSNQSWEVAAGFSGSHRGVPDVSMIASTYSPVYVISQGLPRAIGGTSVGTPIWAAVTTLIKEKSDVNFGSANPLLYQIARTKYYNDSFTQILPPGNNGYYSVTPGWNPVTGLGTPIVSNLVNISSKILQGYGSVVKFMGESYNATGIKATINFGPRSYLPDNGTTFSFVGFYDNSTNYALFGLAVSNDTQSLKLMLRDGNITYSHVYKTSSLVNSAAIYATLSINYTKGTIVAKDLNQTFSTTLPVFLSFAGYANPSVGVWQQGSGTNLTFLSQVSFSHISEFVNGTTVHSTVEQSDYFSYLSNYNSTVDWNSSTSGVNFFYGITQSSKEPNSPSQSIQYYMNFSDPVFGIFSLSPARSNIAWYLNGVRQPSDNISFSHSGYYNVSVNSTTSLSSSEMIAYRTIFVPNVALSNLSISSGLSYYDKFNSSVVIDYLHHMSYSSKEHIPILSGINNNISISTLGFARLQENVTGGSINVSLSPNAINVSVFISPSGGNITFNGTTIKGIDGYYREQVKPVKNFNVTASFPGFHKFYWNVTLYPGINVSKTVIMEPTNASWVELHGNVTDRLFNFGIKGVNVSLNKTMNSYSNSTGYYVIFYKPGVYNITAYESMYVPFHKNLTIISNTLFNISLIPLNVSLVNIFKIRILSDIPFMFYFSYISWSTYKGPGFQAYQVYIANNPSFTSGERVINFQSNTTGSTYVTGILPGQTYYVVVVLRLANGVFYESQIVKLGYSNFLWLGVTLLIYAAIIGYIGVAVYIFGKHKKKDEIEI